MLFLGFSSRKYQTIDASLPIFRLRLAWLVFDSEHEGNIGKH
jgi:hypothetical protein